MLCITCFHSGVIAWVIDPEYHKWRSGHIPDMVSDEVADKLLASVN